MSSVIASKPQQRSRSRAPGAELLRIPTRKPRSRSPANQSNSCRSRVPTYQRQKSSTSSSTPASSRPSSRCQVARTSSIPISPLPGWAGNAAEAASTAPGARPRRRSNGSGNVESSMISSTEPMSSTIARMGMVTAAGDPSGLDEDLDGLALVHGAVALGDLLQRQGPVEDQPGVD